MKNDVVKKAVYDELVKKVNPVDTSNLVKKSWLQHKNCRNWNENTDRKKTPKFNKLRRENVAESLIQTN